jgi:hypothetical protein
MDSNGCGECQPSLWIIIIKHSDEGITVLCEGPLHTRAKSRDHEIVRAQKKVSKGHPNTLPTSCSVVTDPQV